MNPRITSIENLVASDPGGRNIFDLVIADQLRLSAQSLRLARRVGIVSGFYVVEAGAGETDGPSGAKVAGGALRQLGIEVDYITDELCAPLFRAMGIDPLIEVDDYLDRAKPTHLLSIERLGRGADGRYHNMRGVDVTETTPPLDALFLEASRRGLTTIGIGDGGNEIGMGNVFVDALATVPHGARIAATVSTDFCIVAGVSNWGAYGLAGALSVLEERDLLPSAESVARDLERMVFKGGAADGVTHRRHQAPTVDGLDLADSLRMLEDIRTQITPSPFQERAAVLSPRARSAPDMVQPRRLTVGILGYGVAGRSAAALLVRYGHRVCISDRECVMLEPPSQGDSTAWIAGVETGGHSIEFFAAQDCDVVVASPGVRLDIPVIGDLHRRGVPVMSELELAFQLGVEGRGEPARAPDNVGTGPTRGSCSTRGPARGKLIAVTGTIGKRTTVELLQRLFERTGRSMTIGGNRGRPLSELLLDERANDAVALAVSSFQLESVVHFRPDIAILLNIDEAHLDRHRSVAEYIRIKSRIFMNHRPDDVLVLPYDDVRVRLLARKHRGRTFYVSLRQTVDRGAWLVGGQVYLNIDGGVQKLGPVDPEFPENLLSSLVAARLAGISTEELASALEQLP